MLHGIRGFVQKILGLRVRYQLLLVYILGGALPFIFVGIYLVHGVTTALIEQAEYAERTEMEMASEQTCEVLETVSTVTKYFYFDPQLEEIAFREYKNYVDIVNDYREFTSFLDYGKYYNNTIAWFHIYMKNDTIVGNSRFVKVTEEIEQEEWYRAAAQKRGGIVWRYRPVPASGYEALSLLRMLRTRKGEDVGVLVVSLRPERFSALLQNRSCDSFIVLNKDTLITDLGKALNFDAVRGFLPEMQEGLVQKNVYVDRKEYLMTCETIPMVESSDFLQIVSFRAYEDILSEVGRQVAGSVVLFLISVVVSISVIMLLSRSFGNRVGRFREQMQKAAEGNFDLEENLGGTDEISDLYGYLGTMIYRIQKLLSEIYREKLHAERLTVQQKEAEFKMLASQINPHFLYNTLETIRMKARRSRQYDIEELVKMLAKIMRSTLQAGNSEVTVRSEVELVEYYLKIQQYRFEDRIQYEIFVEKGLEELRILPLILQPIVENSIIHGLESKEGTGKIGIRIQTRDGKVVIGIRDDGLGMSAEKLEQLRNRMNVYDKNGKHIGISNVHQRVRLKYGDGCGVTVDSREGSYTKVEIVLPPARELKGEEHVQSDDH